MSSPNLNNLIILGCFLSFMSIFFIGEYEAFVQMNFFSHICVIRVWLLSIAFTFAFGAMFSKTYRVHAILTNTTLIKKVIKDYKLYGIVICLLVIDLIVLFAWQIIDPLRIVNKQYEVIAK
jgi:gamma-aminobutyric acid type B receptor